MPKRSRRRSNLGARLTAMATPVYLLDGRRRVLLFNAGCEQLTGWAAGDVLGKVCDYTSEADPQQIDALTGSLAPPPEVLGGTSQTVPAQLAHKSGRPLPRLIHFHPLTGADGLVDVILCVITPLDAPRPAADASAAQRLHAELAALRMALRQRFGLRSLVARSRAMHRVLEQIALARAGRSAVTLLGEPGTGKEHVARLIHAESDLRNRAFVPLDCRRLPAIDLKLTLRRLLHGEGEALAADAPVPLLLPGTVYLMHVEHLPRDAQQVIVEGFGGPADRHRPDLRLMAASTVDLHQARDDGRLDREFFFLITPLVIELPPLRGRRDDLGPLAQAFLEELNRGADRQVGGFSDEVWQQFRAYNWPGNLDELATVVEEARAAGTGELIQPGDLPFRFRAGQDGQAVGPAVAPRVEPLEPLLERVEREQIEQALAQARHNKSRAAELLGITRPRLYRRMQALGIADLEGESPGAPE